MIMFGRLGSVRREALHERARGASARSQEKNDDSEPSSSLRKSLLGRTCLLLRMQSGEHRGRCRIALAQLGILFVHASLHAQVPPEEVANTETEGSLERVSEESVTRPPPSRGEKPSQSADQASADNIESSPRKPPRSTPSRLLVYLTIERTPLTSAEIFAALDNEFDIPVQATPRPEGLRIVVAQQELTMSYQESADSVIERRMNLPEDPTAQLSTIALLAGSLARDEAGVLIAELRAQGAASDVPPPPLPEALPEERDAEVSGDTPRDHAEIEDEMSPEQLAASDRTPPVLNDDAAPTEPGPTESEEKRIAEKTPSPPFDLNLVYASASLFGPISVPPELSSQKTYAEAGLLFSDIGALEGGAFSLFVLRNRGRALSGAGFGLQFSGIASLNEGDFTGGVVSLLVASSRGRVYGGVAGGLVALQYGDLAGAQGGGLVAYLRGKLTGAQISTWSSTVAGELLGVQASALVSVVKGKAKGAQLASLVNVTEGPMEGMQLATLANVTTGTMAGGEVALVNVAPQLSGFQLGLTNVAFRDMNGVQVGLLNIAGELEGAQVGLVNVGQRGKGTRVGLVNVASEMEGASVAPLNISPGVRNQLVVQASYAPTGNYEGVADGPLYHVGWKFLPDPVYTQLSVGLGPEAEECEVEGTGEPSCAGGGWVFSPMFAVGLRAAFTRAWYGEFDLGYQLERGFSDSRAARHGALARAALGLQLTPGVAFFLGGGPRVDLREGPRVNAPPEVGVGGHIFGGIAFF